MVWLRELKRTLKRHEHVFALLHPFHKAYRVVLMRHAQRKYGINPRKVVFCSFNSTQYNDNPRYISEKLHALCPECEIVWMFKPERIDKVQVPDYVRRVTPLSRKGLTEQATARFWVDNFRHSEAVWLDTKRQYYIQTWHGDRGFKKVGADDTKPGREVLRLESKCAMMIAGSRFGAGNYRTAFKYRGEILMDGCPRNDILLQNDPALASEVRARLGIEPGVKLLMYAPTYRDIHVFDKETAVLDVSRTLDHLEKTTGEPWRCLCRAHYKNTALIVGSDPRIINATPYPEMSELLLITDMLVTDYSSCGADFALQRRPMFLYHADAEEYLRECRDFYIDIEKSPFLVAKNQAELEKLMDETDADAARRNGEALDEFFGTTETGHAAEAVCRYIMDRMDT